MITFYLRSIPRIIAFVLWLSVVVSAKKHLREIQVKKQIELLGLGQELPEFTLPDFDFTASSNNRLGAPGKDNGLSSGNDTKAHIEVYERNVSLPIDYSEQYQYLGNFTNRYWVVDNYYKPGGPVISLDTGESDGGEAYIKYFTNNSRFANQYLQEFGGLGIVWEHRYYGESTPFNISLDTTAEEMRFLTIENALLDFKTFAEQFQWENLGDEVDLSPSETPWIVIGGSYPGARAALLRHLYPETVYAAYAASAPVEARIDMSVYWDQAYRGMVQYGLSNCTDKIQLANEWIDSQLDEPKTAAEVKKLFLGRTADKNSNEGFADTLFFPMYNWQSAGVDEPLRDFCDYMTLAKNFSREGSWSDGEFYGRKWAAWPRFVELVNEYGSDTSYCEGPLQSNSTGNDTSSSTEQPHCLLDERFDGQLSISWTWQYCTQWGFFQSTNIGPMQLGSKWSSLQHQYDLCYRQFPDGLSSGYLPVKPEVDKLNALTDGWKMRPSNVFFTEGQFDPWRTLSPLSTESFSEDFQVTQDIPQCGVSTSANAVFGYVVPDAEHCFDFRPSVDYPPAAPPTELFARALREWLPCFENKAHGNYRRVDRKRLEGEE